MLEPGSLLELVLETGFRSPVPLELVLETEFEFLPALLVLVPVPALRRPPSR